MMEALFWCFAVPFCIISGISAPILMGMWIEKQLGLSNKGKGEGE